MSADIRRHEALLHHHHQHWEEEKTGRRVVFNAARSMERLNEEETEEEVWTVGRYHVSQ